MTQHFHLSPLALKTETVLEQKQQQQQKINKGEKQPKYG